MRKRFDLAPHLPPCGLVNKLSSYQLASLCAILILTTCKSPNTILRKTPLGLEDLSSKPGTAYRYLFLLRLFERSKTFALASCVVFSPTLTTRSLLYWLDFF